MFSKTLSLVFAVVLISRPIAECGLIPDVAGGITKTVGSLADDLTSVAFALKNGIISSGSRANGIGDNKQGHGVLKDLAMGLTDTASAAIGDVTGAANTVAKNVLGTGLDESGSSKGGNGKPGGLLNDYVGLTSGGISSFVKDGSKLTSGVVDKIFK